MFLKCVLGIWTLNAGLAWAEIPLDSSPPTAAAAPAASSFTTTTQSTSTSSGWSPVNTSSLALCQQFCLSSDSGLPDQTYEEARDTCVNLDRSLYHVYDCMSKHDSCPPQDIESISQVQRVVQDYCTSLASLSYSTYITFAVAQQSLPYTSLPADVSTSEPASTLAPTPASDPTAQLTGLLTTTSGGSTQTSVTSTGAETTTSLAVVGSNSTESPSASLVRAKQGLSLDERIGLGVGIGVGVPLLIGITLAFFFFTRRRKNRQGIDSNRYGPVHSSENAALQDSAVYGASQDMHSTSTSASPFLVAPAASRGVRQHYDEREGEHEPGYDHSAPDTAVDEFEGLEHRSLAPATSLRALPMLQTSPATPFPLSQAVNPRSPHVNDEPPSPVSPVSSISGMGSRPTSLHSQHRHHDL